MAMALVFFSSFLAVTLAQTPTATAPIIMNEGPTARCYDWFAEPAGNAHPPISESEGCAGADQYGHFNLATYGWQYPSEWQTSPGYAGSVLGDGGGAPLTVSLTNNAKDTACDRALEVNLSYDYPGAALYANVSSLDLMAYDTIIIEYDVLIAAATTSASDCRCVHEGQPICPSWWKSQLMTDILFYQGPSDAQDFNVISVRNFDPQNNGFSEWETDDGYRVQFSDGQIAPTAGATAHVELDAKYLIHKYSQELCQGDGLRGPIYMRAIQFVMKGTGTDMSVEIKNVKANAFKYAPGTFTSTSVTPGTAPTYCPPARI